MEINTSNYWMPFTANRQYKKKPRLVISAKGMYYTSIEKKPILDGTAGLWCVNAGHSHPKIKKELINQLSELDFAPPFQMGHPKVFEAANNLSKLAPIELDNIFFCSSGSEAVDTSLKIALAYQKIVGNSKRKKLIGRDRGYHGVNFGGLAVGGIPQNRQLFKDKINDIDHIRHPLDIKRNSFSQGMPIFGNEFADEFESVLLKNHDPETIAALIIEPVQGSTGVIIPPKGYLQKIRSICDKYGILLIFDEVITGFGRLGTPFAANFFGVIPDIICCAKALTNAAVPMGAVILNKKIYSSFMELQDENIIEFFHGYTYSGHPLACAAAISAMKVYEEEKLFERTKQISPIFEKYAHKLRDFPYVIDIRNLGLICGIELKPIKGHPTARAYKVFEKCFWEKNILIRTTGDIIALSPPLIINEEQISYVFKSIGEVLKEI